MSTTTPTGGPTKALEGVVVLPPQAERSQQAARPGQAPPLQGRRRRNEIERPATGRPLTSWERAKAKAGPVEWHSSVRPGDWHVLIGAVALTLTLLGTAAGWAVYLGYWMW